VETFPVCNPPLHCTLGKQNSFHFRHFSCLIRTCYGCLNSCGITGFSDCFQLLPHDLPWPFLLYINILKLIIVFIRESMFWTACALENYQIWITIRCTTSQLLLWWSHTTPTFFTRPRIQCIITKCSCLCAQ
jgi:hypothetical protein